MHLTVPRFSDMIAGWKTIREPFLSFETDFRVRRLVFAIWRHFVGPMDFVAHIVGAQSFGGRKASCLNAKAVGKEVPSRQALFFTTLVSHFVFGSRLCGI